MRSNLAAVASCAALLFIAFHIGCLRGLDHTIGMDAWGRMLFGIGGAITDQVFGIKGYALGRTIESILFLNGLTGDAVTLQNLEVGYPENLRNPMLIQDAIEQAASSPYGPGVLRGVSGDDPGFIDFVKLSFTLFGRTVLSLYLTYFVLVAIEVAAFLVAFRNRPSCLALLTVLLVAHTCVINSSLFDHDIGLGSVNNPRFLSVLAIIPALHVVMLVIWREPMTLGGIILVAIQSLLAALAIWIRSSAAWVIIALLALLAGSLIIDLRRRRREGWGRTLIFNWPIAIFLVYRARRVPCLSHHRVGEGCARRESRARSRRRKDKLRQGHIRSGKAKGHELVPRFDRGDRAGSPRVAKDLDRSGDSKGSVGPRRRDRQSRQEHVQG